MKSQFKMFLSFVVLVAGFLCATNSFCGPIFEDRGTLTVGFQVQHGLIMGDATAAQEYDDGTGYNMRLRYCLRPNRAIGVSMESQQFNAVPVPVTDEAPTKLIIAVMTVDYYWYLDRENTLSRYVTVGVGFHHPGREYRKFSVVGPDGLAVSIGGGVEYFFHRVVSVDLSLKGYGLFGQNGVLGSGEAAIGFNFYMVN